MEYVSVVLRTILFYFGIAALYRLMGKREVGKLGVIDLIVSVLIAQLAAMAIDHVEKNIFLSIIPILLLSLIQIVIARLTLSNRSVRNVFDGKPSVIINRGKVNFKEMVKQRYHLDDLLSQLRQKGIKTIEEVDYAILENNGRLSVFQKENGMAGDYPIALILDGEIECDTLRQLKKDETWLMRLLKREDVSLEDIFYGFYRDKQLFVIKHSDLKEKEIRQT